MIQQLTVTNVENGFTINAAAFQHIMYERMKQSCGVWICPSCGLPSFNSSLFNSSFETNNSFGSLSEMNNIMGIDVLKSTSTPVKNTKSSKPGKLKVISINVNGLRSKKLQLYELICSDKPDIVLCQETKIDSSILSAELFPESFIVFRKDRNVNGGGVCIAVRRDFASCALSGPERGRSRGGVDSAFCI